MVRSKVFNSYSVNSITIAKLRTKHSQTATCEYKKNTGNNGNLITDQNAMEKESHAWTHACI